MYTLQVPNAISYWKELRIYKKNLAYLRYYLYTSYHMTHQLKLIEYFSIAGYNLQYVIFQRQTFM